MARTKEQHELIWETLLRDVERFKMPDGSGSIGTVNSKRWQTIQDELEDLAVMLVDNLREPEQDSLTTVTEGIWTYIRDQLIYWAGTVETVREDYRKQHVGPAISPA